MSAQKVHEACWVKFILQLIATSLTLPDLSHVARIPQTWCHGYLTALNKCVVQDVTASTMPQMIAK